MNSGAQRRYRNAYLGLGCGAGPSLRLVLGLLHDPSDQASADVLSMAIAVKGAPVSPGVASSSPRFDVRAASVRADMLDSTGGDATASTLSIELDRKDAGGLALNMDAFAAGYAKLQQSCGQPAQAALPSPAPKPPQREFGEDVWRFSDKPFIELYKRFFFRDGIGEQRRYHDARLSLKCGIGPEIEVVLAHDPAGQSTVDLPPLR